MWPRRPLSGSHEVFCKGQNLLNNTAFKFRMNNAFLEQSLNAWLILLRRLIWPTNRRNSERHWQLCICLYNCSIYCILYMIFLHLWARNPSFLSPFSQTNNVYSCMYRPHILTKIVFPYHAHPARTIVDSWVCNHASMSYYLVIYTCLKLITGFFGKRIF